LEGKYNWGRIGFITEKYCHGSYTMTAEKKEGKKRVTKET
jgi:hypothetical protein